MSPESARATRHLLGGCLASAATVAFASHAAPQSRPPPADSVAASSTYVHEVWTVEDGLPVNSVNGLVQSRDGYLWAATFDGLVRFDGVRFTVFSTGTHAGLPSNRIVDLWETSDGSLWLRSEQNHLARYRNNAFVHFGPGHGLPDNVTRTLHEGRDGTVWIGTDRGFGRILNDQFEPRAAQVVSDRVSAIYEDSSGLLWIGLADGRLLRDLDGSIEELGSVGSPPGPIHSISEGADGTLLVASERGAFRVRDGLVSPISTDPDVDGRVVQRIEPGRDSTELWVYTGSGVFLLAGSEPPRRLSGDRHAVFRSHLLRRGRDGEVWYAFGPELYRNGELVVRLGAVGASGLPPPEEIRTFAQDHEGSIWIGTNSAGLHRLKPALFTMLGPPEGLVHRNVYSIFEDRFGSIYIGTWGAGLNRLRGTALEHFHTAEGVPSFPISFAEDPGGELWIGSFGGGVTRCVLPRLSCRPLQHPQLASARVFALHRSTTGDVWIGTETGLFRERAGVLTTLATGGTSAATTPVRAFAESADGTLWMGTNGGGLLRLSAGELVRITEDIGAPSNLIRALYLDGDGYLWIGTEGRGLARLDPGRTSGDLVGGLQPSAVVTVRQRDGLFDEVIHTILEDDHGRLWMSTNRGIFWVSRTELNQFADGAIDRIHSTSYTERHGLRNREANGGVQPAATRASDGRLWFATQAGAAIVDPNDLEGRDAPRTVVERVLTDEDARLAAGGVLELGPSERDLEIEYTALSFVAPENIRFRYRLDGYNAAWVEAGNRRTAFYTGVPPGAYTFLVQASSGEGVWSEPAAVDLRLEPRFWETRGFLLLAAVAVGALALVALRVRERRLRANEARLSALVDQRTEQIRVHERQLEAQNEQLAVQASKLKALDEAKSRFFANLSHEFRTPLTLTIGPLEDLRSGMRGPVPDGAETDIDLALRNSRRLLRLVNQMLDVARLEAGQLEPRIVEDDLGELLRGIAEGFAPLAERRRIDFRVDITELDLCVFFDADLMEKVFTNLLSNAFKFTPEGGTVFARVHVDDASSADEAPSVVVEIRDSGTGIDRAHLPHVFERFYRAGESHLPGTGIGLSLAKELVEVHGGRIEVESEPGLGSTFRVHLRRGAGHLDPDWLVLERHPGLSPESDPVELGEAGAEAAIPDPVGEPLLEDLTTLLVVDDSADVRSYLRRHLGDSFRILEAGDGERGLEMTRDALPDVVISDVMMPGMTGLDLCRRIKGDAATSFIPVILLTARATAEERLAGLDVGADDYVTKPFDPVELGARARNLAHARRRLWEHVRYEARLYADEPSAESEEERFLDRVRRTIEAHLDDETFDVETLALALGYSRASLYRRLDELVEDSPAEIIVKLRLEKAAESLKAGGRSVSEVAYAVGFKSVSHFSRRFKRRFGMSPSEFRTSA